MNRPCKIGAYAIGEQYFDSVYPADVRRSISTKLEIAKDASDAALSNDMGRVQVLLTGWDSPILDGAALDRLPALEVIMHAAGSVRHIVTDEVWRRGVRVVSAAAANAVPVAEFTVAQIVYALKDGWRTVLAARSQAGPCTKVKARGVFGATIGLASLGLIGQEVARRLKGLGVSVVAYDPFVSPEAAAELGVRLVSLEELFATSDVVSLHTPLLDQTKHMYGADLLGTMRPGATIINTARGALIPTDELVQTLQQRPDLFAVLDVTDPEPLPRGHPLFSLSNAVVTPHIAGSLGSELALMGRLVEREVVRFVDGEPLHHEVTQTAASITA